jgi:hypothetical protein
MLWFFERSNQHVEIETRFENDTREFVVIVRWPDRREDRERFDTPDACRTWLTRLEETLAAQRWTPRGSPVVLPHGWPDSPGRWDL